MKQQKNPRTIRVPCVDRIRKAYIFDGNTNIVVTELYHEFASISGESNWVIKPDYEAIDRLKKEFNIYTDIAGIDVDLRLEEYVRNYTPSFVTQRTIPETREDCPAMLRSIQLDYYDLFEIMCRTHACTGNDLYYVSRFTDGVINRLDLMSVTFDIPDFSTRDYGWIVDGHWYDYGEVLPRM